MSRTKAKVQPLNEHNFMEMALQAFKKKPNTVNSYANARTMFYTKILTNKAKALFEVTCPEDWDKDYMLETLIEFGYFAVLDTKAGVLGLQCGLQGLNVFNRPSSVIIGNSIIGNEEAIINANCVVVNMDGIKSISTGLLNEIIQIYAGKLASCDASIDTNLINTKVSMIFECVDDKQSQEAKLIYDKISRGEPAVFVQATNDSMAEKALNFYPVNVKNAYIADLIQIEKRSIMNEFLTLIGINNANTDKRERLVTDEVNANNDEFLNSVEYWKSNLKDSSEKVRKMFSIDFNIEIKEKKESSAVELPKKEGVENESS